MDLDEICYVGSPKDFLQTHLDIDLDLNPLTSMTQGQRTVQK